MTNFLRKFLDEFAGDNKGSELTVFGSVASGSPSNSSDPEVLQSNSKFREGWKGATLLNAGNLTRNPVQNEWSALNYIHNYQINHILQKGFQEYNTLTEYFIDDKVNSGTKIYRSLTNNNDGNAVTDITNWEFLTDLNTSNVVVVNSEADLPTPAAGKITFGTLEAGKTYLLNETLVTSNEFVVEDGINIRFASVNLDKVWVYVGTGTMLTSSDFGIIDIDSTIFASPSAKMFNLSGAGTVLMTKSFFSGGNVGGNIDSALVAMLFVDFSDFGQGFTFAGSFVASITNLGSAGWRNETATMFTFSNPLTEVNIVNTGYTPLSNETVFNFNPDLKDISSRLLLTIANVDLSFGGTVFAANSLEQDYVNATFSNTININASTTSFKADFLANSLSTAINTVNIPEPINARWSSVLPERMQFQDRSTFVASTDIITSVLEDGATVFTHNFSTDDIIQFFAGSGGTLPTGIVEGQEYFIITDTASTFKISETAGGGAFDFTTDGSGIIYYRHTAGTNALSWLIYSGNEDIKVSVNANFSMKLTGGGTKDMRAVITKSDVSFVETISARASIVNVTSAKPQGSIANDLLELVTGEGIRFEAENLTDSTALDVTDATAIISLV